ncbi:unnamed protein product, partial [Sphenostylis stenocarpa]
MALLRLAPFALLFLASMVFSMKNIEAGCLGWCNPNKPNSCGSSCKCYFAPLPMGGVCGKKSLKKTIEEHPNICVSDNDCVKKGSGDFCAPYPYENVDYG